ncbi:MAG: hypothetical protein IJT62_00755 [Oscillospiraceae bacterium]|nr:hypothetical protein [Oscillospiraceae bacterium]
MIYEVIKEIKNECANNQMRDVFFDEVEISDPDEWIRRKEPRATIEKDEMENGVRYFVDDHGMTVVYTLTPAE